MADEYLWPARNVAEYAYCPRLFYLMEVEGLHLPNTETAEGNRIHRQVDKPSGKKTPEPEDNGKPQSVRSLTLTDDALQLTATLDLAEIDGNTAVPVEYRRGRPRREVDEETGKAEFLPWPTDRVQLTLQAILLEHEGWKVERGLVYYAAENRKISVPIDDAMRVEALGTLEAAKRAADGPRPEPLLNDARCPKCSLQPLCLPDEIHYLNQDGKGEISPRKIWPPRDDGIVLVLQDSAIKVGVRGKSVRVTDKEGKCVKEMPLAEIESISVVGGVQVSTQAICAISEERIPIVFLSGAGRLITMTDPMDSVSTAIRKAQVHVLDDPAKALELARTLIEAKIVNQRTLLQRNLNPPEKRDMEDLAKLARKAAKAESVDSLRGLEGQAAAIYFRALPDIFKNGVAEPFRANGRRRRPAPDPVNSCLSLAYTMLCHECVAALRTARLEPAIGAFHVCRPGRPAFALDLMEPFRPLIADSMAITAFNKGELAEGHFQTTAAGCLLTSYGRKAFFTAYGRRMATSITHPVYDYRLSYRRMIILHARMIAAWLLGEVERPVFLTTR